ncbi:serine/threonine-protein kinase [Streptomyces sp. NPDC058382]|uniref:serine/threonine-protein kinase n=1 Tax=unclassified Streptomyces TaxID=2593676 RepID=UPI00362ABBBE
MSANGWPGNEGRTERIGPYAIERKIGEGGMGTVYLARSRGGRAVAVKVARGELAADPGFRARFRAEVTAARAVGGFHTAPVVDADPDANPPWLATAYIKGPTLAECIRSQGPMDTPGLKALGAALAEALAAIHRCGLVHRDLKPGNIIMAEDGPRVLDFGIARAVELTRLTATGHAFGTPGFLAPEQAMGEDVTGAADVFALGVVLVAAAGGSAFGGGTPMGLMFRSVHEPPDLSAVPPAMRGLVASCLAKEPHLRPGPDQLLDRLEELPDSGAPTSYPLAPPLPSGPPPSPVHSHPPTAVATRAAARPGPDDARDGDAFIAADGDSSVVVDADGVVLILYGRGLPLDQMENDEDLGVTDDEIELSWPEIAGVVHRITHRTRLHITVHLRDGSTVESEIKARRAARAREWHRDLADAIARMQG